MATACAAASAALADKLNSMADGMPLPTRDKRSLLVWVGTESGIITRIEDGRASFEAFADATSVPCDADTTFRFDGLESLQLALRGDKSAITGLLVRRKIKLQGDYSWLEAMRPAEPVDGPNRDVIHSISKELSETVASAIAGTSPPANSLRSAGSSRNLSMWVPDEASQSCMRCNAAFKLFRRRHHCRECGKLLCKFCAPLLRQGNYGGMKRVCLDCLSGVSSTCTDSAASPRPVPLSAESASLSQGGAQHAELAALKEQLQAIQEEYAECQNVQLKFEIADIWQATKLSLLAFGVFLLWCRALVCFVMLVAYLSLFIRFPNSTTRRYTHIFWTALVVYLKIRWMRDRIRLSGSEGKTADYERARVYTVVGRFMYEQAVSLGGYWPKIGQAISMNPLLPMEIRIELQRLQDSMPPSPISDVLKTAREEFGAAAAERLTIDWQSPPLGVASIGQVHRATYEAGNGVPPLSVVVKVQHRGIERKFRQDIWSADILVRLIYKLDSEHIPDLRPVIEKMLQVTLNELDFRKEAANQTRAAKAVHEADVDVIIPTVIHDLVARRAMVMHFVDGVPINKVKEELPWVDCALLVHTLVDHYAVQFAIDGHFHADPHPGNLLVERNTGRLCVLDWGMCISLPTPKAHAYAKLFFGAATSNVWTLAQALEVLGLKMKENDDLFEPMLLLSWQRLMLRDSRPSKAAGSELKQMIDVKMKLKGNGPKRFKKFRFENLPSDLLYYARAVELISFVSGELGVQHPILQTFFYRSHARLLNISGGSAGSLLRNPHALLPSLAQQTAPVATNNVERELQALLCTAYEKGELLGAQLCVLELADEKRDSTTHVRLLAEAAVGVRSWLDPAKVTLSTLFPLLDISKLPVALAVLRLVDSGQIALQDRLSTKWPEFSANADEDKANVTAEHILSHTAGMWDPLPPHAKMPSDLTDHESLIESYASAPLVEAPGASQRYHYTSFGYLCAGVCRHHAGRELLQVCDELIMQSRHHVRIHDSDELFLTLPEDKCDVASAEKSVSSAGLEEIASLLSSLESLAEDAQSCSAKQMVADRSIEQSVADRSIGREHLLDLSIFSRRDIATALLPGLQAFGTARAVAGLMASTATGSVISPALLEDMQKSRHPSGILDADDELADRFSPLLRLGEFKEFGLGVQLVRNAAARESPGLQAWGHMSQNGSVALVVPGLRPRVVVLLLNRVEGEHRNHHLARSVLDIVSR